MSDEVYDPARPPWDKSIPGTHPALRSLKATKAEVRKFRDEAIKMAQSSEATDKQRFLSNAEFQEFHNRTQLASALQYREPKITLIKYRRGLITALLEQGKFDEARTEAEASRPKAAFKDLRHRADEWEAADSLADDHECGCEREQTSITVGTKEVPIELPRRFVDGRMYSRGRDEVIDLWRCRHCRTLNGHDLGPPTHQAGIHQVRAELARVSERQILEKGIPANMGDAVLLKPRT
jgi:hypothetical protein